MGEAERTDGRKDEGREEREVEVGTGGGDGEEGIKGEARKTEAGEGGRQGTGRQEGEGSEARRRRRYTGKQGPCMLAGGMPSDSWRR